MVIPLSMLRVGQQGIVREVRAGRGLIQRLASMGVLPGRQVRVIRSGGAVIVDVLGHRLVLGRGMVHRVMVEPLG
jgi:Fe2+ transport system protein FeoA